MKWAGGVLTAGAVVGLGVYFAVVGLDRADKLATLIGVFVAIAGLALTIYQTLTDRRSAPPPQPSAAQNTSPAMHNKITGGTFYGSVFQGRNTIPGSSQGHDPPPDGACAPGERSIE